MGDTPSPASVQAARDAFTSVIRANGGGYSERVAVEAWGAAIEAASVSPPVSPELREAMQRILQHYDRGELVPEYPDASESIEALRRALDRHQEAGNGPA